MLFIFVILGLAVQASADGESTELDEGEALEQSVVGASGAHSVLTVALVFVDEEPHVMPW